MKALQAILALLLLASTGCLNPNKGADRVNHKRGDTTSVEIGDLLKIRDSLDGVSCYYRAYKDGLSCVRDAVQP